ncbi:MAG: chromophore lyase CpcT/CpeT [Cyanobacteria bacterium P01_D01_bin.71]
MNPDKAFQLLSQTLAGIFQNRDQALADPVWYVHFRLWSYPTSLFAADSTTFFLEQASAAFKQAPYRQRVLRVRKEATGVSVKYYGLKDASSWQGATQDPERLQNLTENDLQSLVKSHLQVTTVMEGDTARFEARQLPGERCQFVVNGETKLVELAFDAIAPLPGSQTQAAFWMYDKGIDTVSEKPTWGAIHGPFKLIKIEDWSEKLSNAISSLSA